jgi:hypothetical protein
LDAGDAGATDATDAPVTATGTANGTLGTWQPTPAMPIQRANFCATVVGPWIVAIGGNYKNTSGGFTKVDDVHVAKWHPDGTLDAWQNAGKAPSPVTECTVAAHGNDLVLLDGIYDDTTIPEGQAFVATLDAVGGTIGAWTKPGALPASLRLLDDQAWADQNELFVLHSNLEGTTATFHTKPDLSSPADVVWLPEFRGRPQWAHTNGFVYVLGGYSDADAGNAVLADVRGASVAPDGTMGAAFACPPLPQPTTFGWGAGVDDYVFVLGGRDAIFGGNGRTTVWSARAGADGKLDSWTPQTPLPVGLSNFVVVSAGDYIYAIGGASTDAVDTVYAAKARF